MSRYRTPRGAEAEYEPGSNEKVLRNLLGINSESRMEEAEAKALESVQLRYLSNDTITTETTFTATLIQNMHNDWLGGIYEWAGSYRTVELTKDDFPFPPAYLVKQNMEVLEANLLKVLTPCMPGADAEVCMAVAKIHADLLLIHPFREGNGRTARWLADLMFLQAGMPLPYYGFAGKEGSEHSAKYLDAVKRGYVGDYRPLADFLARALDNAAVLE